MDNFQSITASPEALAAFLGSIPAIETPWDEAFHRLCCSSCSAADARRLKRFMDATVEASPPPRQ